MNFNVYAVDRNTSTPSLRTLETIEHSRACCRYQRVWRQDGLLLRQRNLHQRSRLIHMYLQAGIPRSRGCLRR